MAPPLKKRPCSAGSSHDPNQLGLFTNVERALPWNHAQQSAETRVASPPDSLAELRLAHQVRKHLARGDGLDGNTLFRLAEEAFEGTLAEDAFSVRDAYDAAELGLHLLIQKRPFDPRVDLEKARHTLTEIERLWGLMPSQTRRTREQQSFQQFSTPAPYAFVCAWAAGLLSDDVVLEPSAGTGALLVYALGTVRDCFANELSDRRSRLLRELFGSASKGALFQENAEHLNATLPRRVRPTVVLMNPPFSQTAGRLGTRRVACTGAEHARQALLRLRAGGRLLAIVGHNMRPGTRDFAWLFEMLDAGGHALAADVEVDGRLYHKCGTTYATRVLVIDKSPVAPAGPAITGRAGSAQELLELLAPVRGRRPALCDASVLDGDGEDEPDSGSGSVIERRHEPKRKALVGFPPLVSGGLGEAPAEPLEVRPAVRHLACGELTESVFDAYMPHVEVPGARPHPTKLVESAAMAAASPPPCTYRPHLPRHIVEEGLLSDAQLETVCYAGQAHSEMLPEGPRCGFFLGDGTGVGKGRQIAGIILDNAFQGRRRAVWISENRSLLRDAMRDFAALGLPADYLFELSTQRETPRRAEGILFVSYDTLKGKPRGRKGVDRLEQIIRWLTAPTLEQPEGVPEAEFDGVIVFDECFPYDTPVLTEMGMLPIGEIVEHRLSLRVLSYDTEQKEWTWRQIRRHYKNPFRNDLVRVIHERGEFVCTANHKIWTEEHGYVPAKALLRGTHLCLVPEHIPNPGQRAQRDSEVLRPGLLGESRSSQAPQASHRDVQEVWTEVRGETQPGAQILFDGVPGQQSEAEGRGKGMRAVRDSIQLTQTGIWSKVLLPIMQQQAYSLASSHQGGETQAYAEGGALSAWTAEAMGIQAYEADEQRPGVPAESRRGEQKAQGKELHCPAGWTWQGDGAPADAGRSARPDRPHGIRHQNETSPGPVRELAQLVCGGYCVPGDTGCYRGRRQQSPHEEMALPGSAEGRGSECTRVVRVEVLERRGAERLVGLHGEGSAVYNLEVEEHHNYVAAGVLVSNCHAMQSALDTKGSRGIKKASQRALAGLELQRRLSNTRVVYVSATGATEVANLAYAERLGLWGRGTPFPTVNSFVQEVSNGGIAAMELVAKDLKAMGLYASRSISYDGVCYHSLVHDLSDYQVRMFNKLVEAWQVVLRGIGAALEVTRANKSGPARAAAYSQFWGAHQRFFLHVLVAMSGPSLLRDIEHRLSEGKSCVVQLVSTMEAATERAYARAIQAGEAIEDLDITPRDQLLQFIQASFPTTQYEDYEDQEGRIRSRPVTDSKGNPVENPEAAKARDWLMLEVGAITVPYGILDQLLDRFGHEAVAEVTGRGRRFVRVMKDGVEQVAQQRRSRLKCNADVDAFMAGKKRILVFSQAGGTGRSYHADLGAENQEQRVLYCVEPGWSSSKCVQGMGRVHRANQRIEPELVLVTTNLKAQRRFLSTIARRLDQLGALTKGQRQTASQGFLSSEFNLETPLSRAALHNWFVGVYRGSVLGVTLDIIGEQMGLHILDSEGQLNLDAIPNVPKFLNRLLSLKTDVMDIVFDSWYGYLQEALEAAREAGKLDVGVETITAEEVRKTGEQHVYTQPRTGAKTHVVTLELTKRTEITSWTEAWAKAREAQVLGFFMGFAVNKRSDQVYALFRAGSRTNDEGQVTERVRRIGIRSNRLFDRAELLHKSEGSGYQPLEAGEAKRRWLAEIEAAPAFYIETIHLVTGAVLPIWDRIAGLPRIYRVQTDEGERMIGRVIAPDHLADTMRALGAEQRKVEVVPAELFEQLMRGARVELSCGWVLRRRLVASEWRIELVGPDLDVLDELERDGVFTEIHAFKTRFFIPTGERAADVLRRVTE